MDDKEDIIAPGISMYWSIQNNEEDKSEVTTLEKKEVDKRNLLKKSEEQIYWPKEITTSTLIENAESKPKKLGNLFHERNLDYISKRRIEKLRSLPPLYNFDRTTMKQHIKFYNSHERKRKPDCWLRADTELTTPPGNKYFENLLLKQISGIQKMMNIQRTRKRNEVIDEKIRHILITLTKEIKNELKRQSDLLLKSIYMNEENTTSLRQYKALEYNAIHERLECCDLLINNLYDYQFISGIELADYLNMNNNVILDVYPNIKEKEKFYEDEDSRLERISRKKPIEILEIKPLDLEPPPPSSSTPLSQSQSSVLNSSNRSSFNNNNNNCSNSARPISPLVPDNNNENGRINTMTNSSSSTYNNNNNNSKELLKPSSPLCNEIAFSSSSVPSTESSSEQTQQQSSSVQQQLLLLQSSTNQLYKPRKSLQQQQGSRKSIHSSRRSPLLLNSTVRKQSPTNGNGDNNIKRQHHEKKILLKKSDKLLAEIANIPKMHQLMPIEEMPSNSLSSIPSKQLSKVHSKTDRFEIEKPVYNGHGPSLIVDETNEILRKTHFTLPKFMPPQENTMVLCTQEQKDYAELKRSKMSYSPIFYQYYGERSFEETKLPPKKK